MGNVGASMRAASDYIFDTSYTIRGVRLNGERLNAGQQSLGL
jgi:hypothetical protein